MSVPHSMKDLSQNEIDAINRILRARKIDEYEETYAMTSSEFLRRWNAGELAPSFDFNHWARLLSREAPQEIVEPPIDPDDTKPVDTSGRESGV